MDWFTAVDIYCERTAPGFWNEPLNAISNLSFILAAIWAGNESRKRPGQPPVLYILIALCFLIGIGSFLFHTFANTWSELADVIPIWTFVVIYILTSVRLIGGVSPGRILKVSLMVIAGIIITFMATSGNETSQSNPETPISILNGSGQYLPAVCAMLILSTLTWKRRHPLAPWFITATIMFMISLTFRTLDTHLCAAWPFGTHQMWHLLNGLMLGVLLQALIRNTARPDQPIQLAPGAMSD